MTRHYTSKGKARATKRAKESTTVRADGLTSSLTGNSGPPQTLATAITTIIPLGSKPVKARVEAKGPTLPIERNTGARFINDPGTPLNGVTITLTAPGENPFPPQDQRAKAQRAQKGKATTVTEAGRAKTSPLLIALSKPLPPFTRNLERLPHKNGGTLPNLVRFFWTLEMHTPLHVTKRTLTRKSLHTSTLSFSQLSPKRNATTNTTEIPTRTYISKLQNTLALSHRLKANWTLTSNGF